MLNDRSEGDEELDTVSSANPPMHRLRKLAESLLAMSFYVAIFGLVVAALSQIAQVLLRNIWSLNLVCLDDLAVYGHASLIIASMGAVLAYGRHVRVDVLSSHLSSHRKGFIKRVNLVLLTVPFAASLAWSSFPYVREAWRIQESSAQIGGLNGLFVLKTWLLILPILLVVGGLLYAFSKKHEN